MKIVFNRTYFLLSICLLKAITSFGQPVVKVPPMCEVVIAGTGVGTSIGFGGVVSGGSFIGRVIKN